MAIDPSHSVPNDVATVQSLQSMTEEDAKAQIRAGTVAAMGNAKTSFSTNILGGISRALRGLFTPGDPFADIGAFGSMVRDGQLELTNRVDLLAPILDYGSVCMPANRQLHGPQVLPFVEQIGPMRGCHKGNNGIVFDDKGLWDIRAQVTFSWVSVLSGVIRVAVNVYRPNGSLFSTQKYLIGDAGVATASIVSSVVVSEVGCYAQVVVEQIAATRGIAGGPAWTRLTAQHISRQVAGEWKDGSGPSDSSPEP